jgi:acyl carrier protein
VVRVDRPALERHLVRQSGGPTAVQLVSCGPAATDQRIAIVDPATSTACRPDQVGEVWVSGPSVAQGYWGRPEETARAFGARIAGGDGHAYLRTGDLGFLLDGELVVTGRLKDLIIVRGQNHYPQDIELTAERADPMLRPGCSAAFLSEEEGAGDDLVTVHEVRRHSGEVDVAGVAARVRQAVAREHGLQVRTVVLIQAGGMPKTPSGKVQRRLCRARLAAGELPEIGRCVATPAVPDSGDAAPEYGDPLPGADEVVAAPAGRRAALLASYLRGKVAAVSGIRPGDLDPDQPLLAAGLDSLAVLQLKQEVETDLGVSLPLAAILSGGASLARLVDQLAGQVGGAPLPRREVGTTHAAAGVAALSYGQRWIWLAQQFEPDSAVYNIAVALRSATPVDGRALHRALQTVVARHPILRATFPVRGRDPVMLVHPPGEVAYQENDVADLDETQLRRHLASLAGKPFDLRSGPLLRLAVFRHPRGDVLLLCIHHIITDFWSMAILARELGVCYTAYAEGREPNLTPPSATYLDVVEHERSILEDDERAGALARYWDEQVGDGVPPLHLPAGRSAGGGRSFSLSESLTRRLHARASAEQVTLSVLLLAAFQAVLHRYTGQDDLAIGTNVAGRSGPRFTTVVGFCTNPVLIRSRVTAGTPFRSLLAQTRDQVIGALEHQQYPTTLLAERQRAAGRGTTLFEVLFTVNRSPSPGDDLAALAGVGPPGATCSLGSLRLENLPLPHQPSGIPLELTMAQVGAALHGSLRYSPAVAEPAAALLVEQFTALLETVAAEPDVPVRLPGSRTARRESAEPAPLTPPR